MLSGNTAPILAELTAVERVLASERAAHAETREALEHAKLRAREARTALAAEASAGVLHHVRKAVADAAEGSSTAQKRLDQLYELLPPRFAPSAEPSAVELALAKARVAAEQQAASAAALWQTRLSEADARAKLLSVQLAQARESQVRRSPARTACPSGRSQ